MTRLGSVLGAILADVSRARVVSDELTRGLADVYRADTVLGSMSVPRLVIDQAELTLRFALSDITEPPPSPRPDAPAVGDAWIRHVEEVVVPRVATRLNLAPEVFSGAASTAVSRPPARGGGPVIERALGGETKPLATATATAMSDVFANLSAEEKERIGNKTQLKNAVQDELEVEARAFLAREIDLSSIRAVLASSVDVEVRSQALTTQPNAVQELRLTIREADLDTLVQHAESGGR